MSERPWVENVPWADRPNINGQFQFVKHTYRSGTAEPDKGIINYRGVNRPFQYHNDYTEGNIYVVYANEQSDQIIAWFTLSYPYVSADGRPVHEVSTEDDDDLHLQGPDGWPGYPTQYPPPPKDAGE